MGNYMTSSRPVLTDPFYIDKFMEIQRQNVVLSNILREIAADTNLREIVENKFGDVFEILKDTPA